MTILSMLTDFGVRDPFVGEMKAVILGLAPAVRIVDLSHGVAPGSVREGAWILAKSWSVFPAGTCHLAVVDPGVGGDRRALAACAGGHFFVGPDNGLLLPALLAAAAAEAPRIHEITLREIELGRRGTTFDGRDVFAPTAARLATGLPIAEVGPEVHEPIGMDTFDPAAEGPRRWTAEIVRADRFGNLVTSVEESFLRGHLGESWRAIEVQAAGRRIEGVKLAYSDGEPGEMLLSIGGSGTLEISVNRASAARSLGLRPGDRVTLLPIPGKPAEADDGWRDLDSRPKETG